MLKLPSPFVENQYIIDVIRHFMDPQFLKTKEEWLRFYVRHYWKESPYTKDLKDLIEVHQYLGFYYNHYKVIDSATPIYYDIINCTKTRDDIVDQLSEDDIYHLADKLKPSFVKNILSKLINPKSKFVKILIELEFNKPNLFPLDKTRLLECSSLKFIKTFNFLFHDISLVKQISLNNMVIKNNFNNYIIQIPKNIFKLYCQLNTLIKTSHDRVDFIVVPFEFNDTVGSWLISLLIHHKFIDIDIDGVNEIDFLQYKQLVSYLQISIQ